MKVFKDRTRTIDDILAEFAGSRSIKAAFVAAMMENYVVPRQI